jgi:hypothetical protein
VILYGISNDANTIYIFSMGQINEIRYDLPRNYLSPAEVLFNLSASTVQAHIRLDSMDGLKFEA